MRRRALFLLSLTYLLFFSVSLGCYMTGSHGRAVLFVNERRLPVLDAVMPIWTHFGDGWFFSIAVLVLLVIRWRSGLILFGLGVCQLLMSALLKRVVFKGTPRPRLYFEELGVPLDLIEGVKVHAMNAFPSGHTMTAFAIATFFTLYSRKLWVGFAGLFLAISTGFSRIYLSQHFLIDVVVGSMVGVALAATIYQIFQKTLQTESESLGF